MPTKAKEKADKQAAEEKRAANLEQLVLDKKEGKYGVVQRAAYWAKQLRGKEEHRHLTQNEVLELALQQVLNGEVSEKEIDKLMAAAPNAGAAEETEKPKKKSLL